MTAKSPQRLTLAVVAHDARKPEIVAWAQRNRERLRRHHIISTATTGLRLREACGDLDIETVKSGPLGGDQQIGAMIAEGRVHLLAFFPDPLTPMPHDVDVKALLRLALVYNVPCALNPRTADLVAEALLGAGSTPGHGAAA